MGPVEQAIWAFTRVFGNACTMVGLIGVLGSIVIFVNRSIDKLLNEEKEK